MENKDLPLNNVVVGQELCETLFPGCNCPQWRMAVGLGRRVPVRAEGSTDRDTSVAGDEVKTFIAE